MITLLKRMIAKGMVCVDESATPKTYRPQIDRQALAQLET